MEVKSIQEIVREMEQNDQNGTTTLSKYVQVSMREDIDKTEAYLNSKHITGEVDSEGREKPFFNISLAHRNIWFRATDIDRKDIKFRAKKLSNETAAFLATLKLQDWMRSANFGKFLNDWGLSLATHGSSILKFIEKDKKLHCQVIDWNNVIVDPIDFENNVKIEKFWFTPAQLKKQNYNKDLVKKLLETLTARTTINGQQKDNRQGYIPVYEVHGELSLAQYKMSKGEEVEEGDEDEYFQQMHVVSFLASSESGEYDDYTLYSGKEAQDPYLLTHLLEKDGQTYVGGAVKNLFEAQWMVNHNQKQIKDQVDLASKIVFQTSDKSFVGQNTLTNIQNGDILVHEVNQPLTMLNNKPDIAAMQSAQAAWQSVASQINGVSEAMLGENPPSGSAWRQTQALLQESHSLFEAMTENKGLAIEEMMRRFVIPYFKKQLNNSDEIAAILEDYQIKQIDSRYLPNEVTRRLNQKKKNTILSGQIYDPGTEALDAASIESELKSTLTGNQRFIKPSDIPSKTWKDIFKDLEDDVEVDVTGESKDVQGTLATLTNVLQTVVSNPAVLQDPNAKLVFNKIIGLAGGISPLELVTTQANAAPLPQPMPAMAQPQPQ